MMKFKVLCVLLALLLFLTACTGAGTGGETTESGETTAGEPSDSGTTPLGTEAGTDPAESTTSGETDPPEELPVVVLPRPYIDIEFDGMRKSAHDRMNRVICEFADPSRGSVVLDEVYFDGEAYAVPHYRITEAGGVLRMTYQNLTADQELHDALICGFAMEAFVVNHEALDSGAGEQSIVSSTQSGGYNLTVLRGKYTASVYTDGAYRNAILSGSYDTRELTHLLNVYDPQSKTVSLYVNGELVDSAAAPGLLGLATGDCYRTVVIGGDINDNGKTNLHANSLTLTDFKLYRTPLTAEQAEIVYERAVSELTRSELPYRIEESDSEVNSSEAMYNNYFDSFVMNVYQPETALENPPTVLQYADARVTELAGEEKRPATVLFEVDLEDGELYARTHSGEDLGGLDFLIGKLGRKMIPAFRINTAEEGKALAAFINANRIADCFVISANAELLQKTADATFAARPLLDLTARTEIDAEKIFLETAKIGVKTVLLDASILDPADVTALRARSVAVVAVLGDDAGVAEIHSAVHTAVSGILTDDYGAVLSYYETVTDRTLGITPLIVAHRGDPESHPDNMIRSIISAAESGATSIEFDIWMSKDGHIFLNHDNVTTNFSEKLKCKEATRAQLEALTYNGPHAQAGDKIAFLEEVFELFATEYTDKVMTIEVKDVRTEVIDKTVALAKQYGVEGRMLLIGMNHTVSNYTYATYGLGCQMNQSYLVKAASPSRSLMLGVMESTILHSSCFTKHSEENELFMQMIAHRLIKYSTWTSDTLKKTTANYLCGVTEYTTNFPHTVDYFYRYLTVSVAEDGTVKVTGKTYCGDEFDLTKNVSLVVLEGSGTFENGKLSGSGTFAFRFKYAPTGEEFYLCTPAVKR